MKLLINTTPNGKRRTTTKLDTHNPVWEEEFQFLIDQELQNDLGKSVFLELILNIKKTVEDEWEVISPFSSRFSC